MKKILGVLCMVVLFFACSEDDSEIKDPIIGTWNIFQLYEGGVDVTDVCAKKTTAEFFENGKFTMSFYESDGNDCHLLLKQEATWKQKKENSYDIYSNGAVVRAFDFTFFENNTKVKMKDGTIWKKQ